MNPLLQAKQLKVYFPIRSGIFKTKKGMVKAVDGVDLSVNRGETLAIVGESGSGKSTLGRALLRLGPITEGQILWENKVDVLELPSQPLRAFRRKVQMVFQDPFASLNPRHSAKTLLMEPLRIHHLGHPKDRDPRVSHLLESVGLSPSDMTKYPHQFSGGQRQRLAIARALAVEPELIVADEPISALDMSVQAQILGLLEELKKSLGLTFIFISHDLGVVQRIANRVLVLYLGHSVEEADAEALFRHPMHPYTKALLASSTLSPKSTETPIIKEDISSAGSPKGCPFQTRCPKVKAVCKQEYPPWIAREGGKVACWLFTD